MSLLYTGLSVINRRSNLSLFPMKIEKIVVRSSSSRDE